MLLHTCRLSGCVFRSFCYVLRGPNEGLNPSECGCFCVCGWCKEDRQEVRYNVDRNSSLTRCVCVWDGFMPQSCQTSASSWYPQTFFSIIPCYARTFSSLGMRALVITFSMLFPFTFPQFTFSYAYQS